MTKILIVDDHLLFAEGLKSLIDSDPNFKTVAIALTGRQAVDLAARRDSHVILIDVSLPDVNGIQVTRRIHQSSPHIKIIGLSMHACPQYVRVSSIRPRHAERRRSRRSRIRAQKQQLPPGDRGYKGRGGGGLYFSPELAGALSTPDSDAASLENLLDTLPEKQLTILKRIAQGYIPKPSPPK